jgi:CubicO group peptidase (beta-lactamase class C family)
MMKNRNVYGAAFCVENGDASISWAGGAGNIKADDKYFITSVTKLYMTAILLMLRAEGKLAFTDKMYTYFPEELINGIHVLDGVDYTKDITITHLLTNTSGIPDYFFGDASTNLFQGKDESWSAEGEIQSSKGRKPKFKPGQKGKVNYSDTNYALLGGIIEKVTGKWVGDVFKERIFEPLKLKDTYAYQDIKDTTPVLMYYKSKQVNLPQYMASVTAEGGIVSTSKDTMVFLKAFFNGVFFPKEALEELKQDWNMLLFPGQFYFGLGLEKLWTPRFLSPFKPVGDVLGFWGQSGAFAFYNPTSDLYFTGTINQLSGFGHNAAYKAMTKIIKSA